MEDDILAFGHDLVAARTRLRQTALSLSGDDNSARQLVQGAITEAWRSRSQFRPGQNLDEWLHGILRNRVDGERRSFAED